MKTIKIEKTVVNFMAMEKVFERLSYIGNVPFMIFAKKNHSKLGILLKEYRFDGLTSPEYKNCLKELKLIKSNILGDKQSFDDDMKERYKKSSEEYWNIGRNKKIKSDMEKKEYEWKEHIKKESFEVNLYCIEAKYLPSEMEKEDMKNVAMVFVQLCEELVI